MKGKIFLIVAAIVVALALTAFVVFPTTESDKQEKVLTTESTETECVDEENGYPCPCSNYICPYCKVKLDWSAQAYYVKTGKKCIVCNGKGNYSNGKDCEYCINGDEIKWISGCKCPKCDRGFERPDDCR